MENDKVLDWQGVFSEIAYAHEAAYPPHFYTNHKNEKIITFHKLSICDNGYMEYKGMYYKYDVSCWWKVEMLYKLFQDDKTLKTLYGQ